MNWLSIEEMAGKCATLEKIVPEMLRERLLEEKFPNTPNHPYQRYKSK